MRMQRRFIRPAGKRPSRICASSSSLTDSQRSMEEKASNGVPQFATAEYSQPGAGTCKSCGKTLAGPYYRVNGVPVCGNCTQRIQERMPGDSRAAFVRGIFFGMGGAIVGLALYVGFA